MSKPLVDGLCPKAARDRLSQLEAMRPDVKVLSLVLGQERVWEVIYSTIGATDPVIASLFPAIPPESLRRIVSDWQTEMFLWTGYVDVSTFLRIVDAHGLPAAGARPRILDFGGGCGRLSRFLNVEAAPWDVSMSDVNGDMVQWCQANLTRVACFRNDVEPPLPAGLGTFDILFGLSVFTHLNLAAARRWMQEFGRAIRSKGLSIITTHGERVLDILSTNKDLQHWFRLTSNDVADVRRQIAVDGAVFIPYDRDTLAAAQAGATYGTTFISPKRVEALLVGTEFEIVEFRAAGLRGWQDIFVLRRL